MTRPVREDQGMIAVAPLHGRTPAPDLLLAGFSGPLLRWTFALLGRAMARRCPSAGQVSIGETAWTPPEPGGTGRLFFGDFVNEDWAATLKEGLVPAVLVIDDMAAVCADMLQAGLEAGVIVRHLVAVATAQGDLAGQPNVLLLRRADFSDPVAAVARIMAHAGLPAEPFNLFAGEAGPAPWDMPPPPPLPASVLPLMEAVVTPALQYGCTGIRGPVAWPRDCLLWGDHPGTPLPRVLDMTGPARVVAYGPYYALPSGSWTVRATLAFSPASRGMPLALELHGANVLGGVRFPVEQAGLFAASFIVVVPSSREPLEIRLLTERGAIEGTLGIDRIDLMPTARFVDSAPNQRRGSLVCS